MTDTFARSFDPDVAALMKSAFEDAWATVKASGSVDAAPYRAGWARETLALRIIDNAHRGERDATKLRDDALEHLAQAKFGIVRGPSAHVSNEAMI